MILKGDMEQSKKQSWACVCVRVPIVFTGTRAYISFWLTFALHTPLSLPLCFRLGHVPNLSVNTNHAWTPRNSSLIMDTNTHHKWSIQTRSHQTRPTEWMKFDAWNSVSVNILPVVSNLSFRKKYKEIYGECIKNSSNQTSSIYCTYLRSIFRCISNQII